MLANLRLKQLAQMRLHALVRALLVRAHQARISGHIGGEDRGETAADYRGGHGSGAASFRAEFNLLRAEMLECDATKLSGFLSSGKKRGYDGLRRNPRAPAW